MTDLLTAAQMREIEQTAIASGDVTGLELMERAGRGVVEAIFEEWPCFAKALHCAVVLCGPGNNGGDGFVVARLLREWGWGVNLYLYGRPGDLRRDAKANYQKWGQNVGIIPADTMEFDPGSCDLIIDGLFGTGLVRGLDVDLGFGDLIPVRELRSRANRPYVVAIDLPSGLCSDSGRRLDGNGLWADLTVSFHSEKTGHRLAEGPEACGKTVVKDIGIKKAGLISPALRKSSDENAHVSQASNDPGVDDGYDPDRPVELTNCTHNLSKSANHHKYSHGHGLILSGGAGKGGAGRLAARAALRIGAGAITLGCLPEALLENAAQLTAVMLKTIDSDDDLSSLLEIDQRINALCLGPGLGMGAREAALVASALSANHQTVLDADALTLISQNAALFSALHDNCVLTPHQGEFERLFPDISQKLKATPTKGPAYSKIDATRDAAARAGCVVLFKGPDTVIASPTGRCFVNSAHYDRAAPWLATAGSGDVLAGFITGLLARGLSPLRAAETAAWLHVECALRFGPGLIAEDIAEQLPAVFRDLGL